MKSLFLLNIKRGIFIYFLYSLVFGSAIFSWVEPVKGDLEQSAHWFGTAGVPHRAAVLESGREAGNVRIEMINQAEESLSIAYHTFHAGEWTDLFTAKLLEAADREVDVKILMDGLLNNMRGDLKAVPYLLAEHPHITLKYYEPFRPLNPVAWHNRLHDKLIIADDTYALTGGRNMGDKYFTEDHSAAVKDRDVLITYDGDGENSRTNAVSALQNYFDDLFFHDFSYEPVYDMTPYRERAKSVKKDALQESKENWRTKSEGKELSDLRELAMPVDGVQLWHNPLNRLNHDPAVWKELIKLFEKAEESIMVQSPYIIPAGSMTDYLNEAAITAENIVFLTNSKLVTPNLPGYAGYHGYREKLSEKGVDLNEYTGSRSIHGKSFVVDSYYSGIGSFNLDPRSAFLNTETMVVIKGEEFAEKMEVYVEELLDKSILYNAEQPDAVNEHASPLKKAAITILTPAVRLFEHLL